MDNSRESKLMTKATTNPLNLNWRKRLTGGDETCPCCGHEQEALEHFLLHCAAYSDIRKEHNILSQPYQEVTQPIITKMLLFKYNEYNTARK